MKIHAPQSPRPQSRDIFDRGESPVADAAGVIQYVRHGRTLSGTPRLTDKGMVQVDLRVTFRIRQRLRPRTLRRTVRFGGNAVMAARSAPRQRLRIR